eukprot:4176972-Karenia_brevis.AAC.1
MTDEPSDGSQIATSQTSLNLESVRSCCISTSQLNWNITVNRQCNHCESTMSEHCKLETQFLSCHVCQAGQADLCCNLCIQ